MTNPFSNEEKSAQNSSPQNPPVIPQSLTAAVSKAMEPRKKQAQNAAASVAASVRANAKAKAKASVVAKIIKTAKINKDGIKTKRFRLKISPTYLIMIAVMFLFGQGNQIIVYTAAMVLHELAHAGMAEKLGYSLVSFRLMPYGASLTGNFEGARHKDELLIAAAGPVFNVLLAIPAVALWWLVPASYYITRMFVAANLFIALFNLLPVFPLDGGRMLLAALSLKMPRQNAYKKIRVFGLVAAALLAVLFGLSLVYRPNISFGFVAIFMFLSSIIPDKVSYYQRLYTIAYRTERLKRGLNIREIMVSGDSTVLSLNKMLSGNHYTRFVVMGADFKVLGVLTETELESLDEPPNKMIKECKKLTGGKKHI